MTRVTAGEFSYIRDLVRDHSALLLEPGKEYLVESRLEPMARSAGFTSFHGMVENLRETPFGDLHRRVGEAMTNNETTFFRDARMFGMLRQTMLPELLARRGRQRSLNIWSAACSSGQEPFSVAMLLREHRPALDGWHFGVTASDVSRDMLARARAGSYSQLEVNRGLPANLLVKYFLQNRAAWELDPEIRRMVDFREINLIQPWPLLPAMDVVLMRNVLIYLDAATKNAILSRVATVLAPDGYLILGGAETTTNLNESFESVSLGGAMCFQLKGAALSAPIASRQSPPTPLKWPSSSANTTLKRASVL
jgi:chemotaxis protein methyltransferase CheR